MATVRRPWTRDETRLAYRLYCELSFGQLHHGNPRVKSLAKLIERSPGSIALKLANFAHLDPSLARRGMGNVSQLDREVAAEFSSNWERLVQSTELPDTSTTDAMDDATVPLDAPTEALRQAKVRLTQRFFRRAVLSAYDMMCSICGIDLEPLLIASHIKPWSIAKESRTDPRNGIAFCVMHDGAFDRGLLTVTPDCSVLIGSELLASKHPLTVKLFREFHQTPLRAPSRFAPDPVALEFHQSNIFRN